MLYKVAVYRALVLTKLVFSFATDFDSTVIKARNVNLWFVDFSRYYLK